MAISQNELFGRARVLATGMGGDANTSVVIDGEATLKALLPHVIRQVYRKKANDVRNRHDIVVKHTVAITASSGAVPTTIMREFLPQADFQDSSSNKCIAWMPYAVDYNSGVTFTQIGYVTIVGDNFNYRAPSPNQSFTGSLYVTVPTMPTIPTSWSTDIDIDATTTDDVILTLALALRGEMTFDGVSVGDKQDGV